MRVCSQFAMSVVMLGTVAAARDPPNGETDGKIPTGVSLRVRFSAKRLIAVR
jgi:hypothetical protein